MQTPSEFIAKWKASTLKERSASQEHFLDLCRLIGHPTSAQSDPAGEHFTFERGASKTGSGLGWADVWKKGCFAWEYKGKNKDLNTAFAQLQRYAIALENPPLLVVSDMETIVIHTNWTNTVQEIHTIAVQSADISGLDESACLVVKNIRKPCAGKPQARFDEGGRVKPALYSTYIPCF
jgi:hypothetical protein